MSDENPAAFRAAFEMDFTEFDLEDDVLDYERSPSPCDQVLPSDEDKDVADVEVSDSGSIDKAPARTLLFTDARADIGELNFKRCSAAATSKTTAASIESVCPQKVAINLESFVTEDSAETRKNCSSPTEANQSNAPPSTVLQLHYHGGSMDVTATQHDTESTTSFSHCSPKVTFNPSSLIFKSNCREGNEDAIFAESSFGYPFESLESQNSAEPPQVSKNLCFDPSSLHTDHSISGPGDERHPAEPPRMNKNVCFGPSSRLADHSNYSSGDELHLAPTNSQTNFDLLRQQSVTSNPSFNSGFQAAVNVVHTAPSGGVRGILKFKNPLISHNEKIVAHCLKLLCQPANDEKHQDLSSGDVMQSSAKQVFENLCFDQFFQKGECFSSICDDSHNYKSHVFSHPDEEMWNASLYVICHAALPSLQIVENLIQHYTAKCNLIHALLLAKCIAKVKDADRLELAHFIVNKLSGIIPTRDVITVILMLNFSELSSVVRFNQLMEGLGVFEQNTTHYSELMAFLNFHNHKMPAKSVCKLMEDSMKYSCEAAWLQSISGFLKRLHPSQKDEVQPIANEFRERFSFLPDTSDLNQNLAHGTDENRSKSKAKKVNFAAAPDVREFEVADCPREIQCQVEPLDFSDEDCEDEPQPDVPDFYGSSDSRGERLSRVFGESCRTWILNGRCSNTDCNLTHDFTKDSLANLSSEDVRVAADYVIHQSLTPSIEILKIFIEFLAESNETARVLSFRKCTLKMSTFNCLRLTKLVITFLSKQIGVWEAIEKVLVPDVMELDDLEDGHFIFDKGLLCFIMSEAIRAKTTVLRCVTRAIMQQIANLPPDDNAEMVRISSYYIQKFVMTGKEMPLIPDVLPARRIPPDSFASHLKVALYQGVPSRYFLATAMMRQAVQGNLRDQAFDVLYTFLLTNFDRARVLTHLLENCKYFDGNTSRSVRELFGTVGLTTSIRLYENENFTGTALLLNVLQKFKLNIFTLISSGESMTEFNLATIYCNVIIETVNRNDAIDVFFNRCVDPYLKSASSLCPPDLIKLTSKMFHVFTCALLIEESLKLYRGIVVRQKSLASPLNIEQFVEPTLRCTFNRLCDIKIRKESLKMYLDVVDSDAPIAFQKVTHRSMFLIALMEITHASHKFEVKGHINVIHPLIKKMLLVCIKEGAYFDISTPHIALYSSMTAIEIEVYVMWWFFLYVRARKRQAFDYFNQITVRIVQDCIQDDSRLPVHPSLQDVSASVTACAERVASVIKSQINEPMSVVTSRERGVFELHPATTRALSQTASNIMLQHGYIQARKDRMCTFCLDSSDVKLADKL